ncbi:MAG TPA: hypothetical protein VKM55_21680, partial [Candidatus Lokiarchaeia archaeon]|nr:hypothetical protein [Candidatus Lokiarchaeia archaeon]
MLTKFKITILFMVTAFAIIMFYSFNNRTATMPSVQPFEVSNPYTSAYTPPSTTLSPTSGWVTPTTTFTLAPSGSFTSTAYAYPAQKNDIDFAGGTSGNNVNTITNWTNVHYGAGYTTNLVSWPQTNSWSNYSSVNTASGYNKLCAYFNDASGSNNPSDNYLLPGYRPTSNGFYYISYEVRPMQTSYGFSQWLTDPSITYVGITFQFENNGSITFNGHYSISTSSHTCYSYSANTDYFIRIYLNPITYKAYWAMNGTVYNNGGNYWNWYTSNTADTVLFQCGGNNAATGSWYLDNLDFSWEYTFPASSWTTVGSPYQFTLGNGLTDGQTVQIGYNSTGAGGVEFTHLATVQYDKSPPTTTISYSSSYTSGPITWILPTTAITLTATDAGSGVAGTGYSWVGIAGTTGSKAWGAYSSPFSITANGTYQITYCSWDNIGFNATPQTTIVRIDSLSPTTTISYKPAYAASPNFVNSTTTFTLNAADNGGGSGVKTMGYAASTSMVPEENFEEYSNGVNLVGQPKWSSMPGYASGTVYHDATYTNLGRFTAGQGAYWTLPTISGTWIEISFKARTSATTMRFQPFSELAADKATSVGGVIYFYNNGWLEAGSPDITHTIFLYSANTWYWFNYFMCLSNNSYYVQWSTDGNTWLTNAACGSHAVPNNGYNPGSSSAYMETFAHSGDVVTGDIDNIDCNWSYTFPASNWKTYNVPFNVASAGNGTVYIGYNSTDNVGNVETTHLEIVRLDAIAPTTTISNNPAYSASPNFVNSTTTFTLNAADSGGGSGKKTTGYAVATSLKPEENFEEYSNGVSIVGQPGWTAMPSYSSGTVYHDATYTNLGRFTGGQGADWTLPTISGTWIEISFMAITSATNMRFQPFWVFESDKVSGVGGDIYFYNDGYLHADGTVHHAVFPYLANTWYWFNYFMCLSNNSFYIQWSTDGITWQSNAACGTHAAPNNGFSPGVIPVYMATFSHNGDIVTGDIDNIDCNWTYTFPASSWNVYSAPFNVATVGNGTAYIGYNSTDNAGNVETTRLLIVRLDTIPPTTSISYTAVSPPNIVNPTTLFTLTFSDNPGGSGIASTQYQYDGSGGYHAYTAPFTLSLASNGSITINYYSIDHAGNVETAGATVVLMISNPVATSTPATAAMITPNSTF